MSSHGSSGAVSGHSGFGVMSGHSGFGAMSGHSAEINSAETLTGRMFCLQEILNL